MGRGLKVETGSDEVPSTRFRVTGIMGALALRVGALMGV